MGAADREQARSEEQQARSESRRRDSTEITLTSTGITLLGVLLSIGLTVGFGIKAEWWIRLPAGAAVVAVLVVAIKLGTSSRQGVLSRMASWIENAPD